MVFIINKFDGLEIDFLANKKILDKEKKQIIQTKFQIPQLELKK